MTRKKKALIIFALIAAASFALIAYMGLKQKSMAQAAFEKVATARKLAEEGADAELAKRNALLNKAGVVGQRYGTSKVDICYVRDESSDGGWTSSGWFQGCYLRYVESYVTDLSREEVLARLVAMNPEARNTLGYEQSVPDPPTRHCDVYLTKKFYESVVYLPANFQTARYNCEVPDLLRGAGGLEAVVSESELSVQAYSFFDPASVDTTKNYIWIMFDKRYYREDLGCGFIIVCPNPRSQPSHPSI